MAPAGTERRIGRPRPPARAGAGGLAALAASALLAESGSQPPRPIPVDRAAVAAAYGRLPVRFEPNLGQVRAGVRFLARGPAGSLYLTRSEAVVSVGGDALGLRWLGGAGAPAVTASGRLPGSASYFVGRDPARWRTGIPAYARVRYRSVYPGIDLIFHGQGDRLEYDFTVAAGASPRAISLGLRGARGLGVDRAGDLRVRLAGGTLVQQAPHVYQVVGGARRVVAGRYVLAAGHRVGFAIGRYDRRRPLIIDPAIVYSTYLGGGGHDVGLGIAVDGEGQAYVTGNTGSTDFPLAAALEPASHGVPIDAFVTKLNAAGTAVVYSTYLGGSGYTDGRGVAVDGDGNAYVTGATNSRDFPTHNPMQRAYGGGPFDMYVTKIDPQGSALVYSTFAGSAHNDRAYAIAVDTRGEAVFTGRSARGGFPTAGGIAPAASGGLVVAKLNPAGSAFVYSTVLGGGDFSARENVGFGVAVDSAGNAYVTGGTSSTAFPTVHALQPRLAGVENAFVTKIDAAGDAIDYSTYLGGSRVDIGIAIAAGADGSAYVAGQTTSRNFPTRRPLRARKASRSPGADAFVAKLDPRGRRLVYSTFLGGSVDASASAIAVDAAGRAHVTGYTASGDFPGGHRASARARDGFLAVLSRSGSALAALRSLGGSGDDIGEAIALDPSGAVYLTGATTSTDFPVVRAIHGPPAKLAPIRGGGASAFVAKLGRVSGP